MSITKIITPYPQPAPNPIDRATFNVRAAAKVAHDIVVVDDINVFSGQANALKVELNILHNQVDQAKLDAQQARTQAQGSAQQAGNSQTACQSALNSTISARDATLIAASEVGALDLARANLAVKRQTMKFFNLDVF